MEIANIEQAAAWDGPEGDHWTEHADRYERVAERTLAHLGLPDLVDAADHVLDLGCGTGLLTLDAARLATEGTALGVDLSSRMLAFAADRASREGVPNVRYEQADVQVHPFEPASVDLVLSSYGVMFFGDPDAAWSNIARTLRPGGRLAVLVWRRLDENEWLMGIRRALALGRDLEFPPPEAPTPFSLADPERARRILTGAGLEDVDLVAIDEPMEAGRDADDAYEFIRGIGIVNGLLDGVDEAGRAEGLANLRTLMKGHETDEGVLLPTASWLITAQVPR